MSVADAARRGLRLLGDTLSAFFAQNGMFLSAGLAFYVVLYCFPLLLLFVTGAGYVLEHSDRAFSATRSFLERLLPTSERAVDEALSGFVEHRGLLSVVTVGAFLLFGTFLFGAVRHVLNSVFGVEQRRSPLRALGADITAMLGTGGLMALTVALATVGTLALEIVSRIPALHAWIRPGSPLLYRLFAFLFAWALLYLLFRVAPAKSLSGEALVAASLVGALLLEFSKWLFAIYVREARDFAVFYGALGGLVFFVLWIYYASAVFVLAATFGRVFTNRD